MDTFSDMADAYHRRPQHQLGLAPVPLAGCPGAGGRRSALRLPEPAENSYRTATKPWELAETHQRRGRRRLPFMRAHLYQIVVDCREPRTLVRFWARLLGGDPVDGAHGWSYVEPPGFARLAFQPVPESKAVKNRLHLDIAVDDIEAAATEAVGLGSARVGETETDDQGSFQSMLDPEGNEFCFVSA